MNICENPTPLKCYKYIYKQLITETMSSKKHLSIFKIYSLFFSSNECPLYFLQYLQSLLYIIYEFSLCEHIYMFICSTISLPPPHPTPTPTNCLRTPGKVLTDDLIANTFFKIPQSEHIKFIFSDRPFTTCLCHSNLWDN